MTPRTKRAECRQFFAACSLLFLTSVIGACETQQTVPETNAATISVDTALLSQARTQDSLLRALRDSAKSSYDSVVALAALNAHILLGHLGYISGPFEAEVTADLTKALKAYERDHGLPVTGRVTNLVTTSHLDRDERASRTKPQGPGKTVGILDTYARAEGAWQFVGMGDQEQAVRIECWRERGQCTETLATHEYSEWSGYNIRLNADDYRITSWDRSEISATANFSCARYALTINDVQHSVTKVRTVTSAASECAILNKEPLVVTLVDGWQTRKLPERANEGLARMRLGPKARALLRYSADSAK